MKITHHSGQCRFIATNEDGEVMGEIAYQPDGDILQANHTQTQERFQGQGVAGKLLDALVEYARKENLKIVPICSYVVHAFEKDPERFRDVSLRPND
jgi:Predicted acetyltransferase